MKASLSLKLIAGFGLAALITLIVGIFGPEFNDEVQKGRSIGPSTIATKTCIVCLPQLQNTGASLWKVITQKPQKSIYTCPLLNEKKYL